MNLTVSTSLALEEFQRDFSIDPRKRASLYLGPHEDSLVMANGSTNDSPARMFSETSVCENTWRSP